MEWQHYLWEAPRPADPSIVSKYAALLGITFPREYIEEVIAHQGMVPAKNIFRYHDANGENMTCMGPLFHFEEQADAESQGYDLLEHFKRIQNRLPPNVIPFSEDPGGFPIAFDFRHSEKEPAIVLVNFDASQQSDFILPIAASLKEFLEGLMDDDEIA